MKIFLDTSNSEQIKQYAHIIDGITTNPTNLSRESGNPTYSIRTICSLMHNKDVSVEVTEEEPQAVAKQAREIAELAENVVVKIPCHSSYYSIIQQLVQEEIRVNVTLVFTVAQGLFMAKMGVAYISPFVGRWNDIGINGTSLLYQMRTMIDMYNFSSEILAASLRDVTQLEEAIIAGADAATVSPELLQKAMVHPLTAQGMATFAADWKKVAIKQFPTNV